jgi:hypothetical protein
VSAETRILIAEKAKGRPGSLAGITGKKHPRYKKRVSRDLKNPSNADYVWKNSIRKLFKYKCALTGVKTNLVSHHINGYNAFPDQRYDLQNGVLISKNIHKEFHDIYKYGDNTQAQWEEFCLQQYNIDWDELRQSYFFEI